MQSVLNESGPAPAPWPEIAPLLDAAMAGLGEREHSAIVLRYFEGRDMKQVGAALGVTENAAKTRVCRAVEKLRRFFAKRGAIFSAAVLTAAISAHSVQAAPAALARSVTAAAVKGAALGASTSTLIHGALKIMAWTKAKTAAAIGVGLLLAIGTTTAILEYQARAAREKDFIAYAIQHRSLTERLFPGHVNNEENRRKLVGAWSIAAKRFSGRPKFIQYPGNNPHLKIWTMTNWAIVTYDAKSNIVYSASGPYDLRGDVYNETVADATGVMTNYIGATRRYKLRVLQDKYYQMGSGIEEMGERMP